MTVPTQFHIEVDSLAQTELVEQTYAQVHGISVVIHVAGDTTTKERNEIPNAVGVVAANHVGEVQKHILAQGPVTHEFTKTEGRLSSLTTIQITLEIVIVGTYLLAPDTLQFGTETDARSEPLTDGHGSTNV